MLIILYSMLVSYMLFFTTCIAPVVNTVLERKVSSKLLRKIFPRNFAFGLIVSLIAALFSLYEKNITSMFLSLVLIVFFLINLFYVMPNINAIADEDKKKNVYSIKFKRLHLISVILYLFNMMVSIIGIIICY